MNATRFDEITSRYSSLRIGVLGDFCLDRYLEIDPTIQELSIETGLPVHHVVRVRAQPGGAGTVLQNLVGLGVGALHAVGFCGEDGEGFELRRGLERLPGVELRDFVTTSMRRTFTYCKPLLVRPDALPQELSRLDSKNWSATPEELQREIAGRLGLLAPTLDAILVMEQVDRTETGVATPLVRETLASILDAFPKLTVLADSRAGLGSYPSFLLKMNLGELSALAGAEALLGEGDAVAAAAALSARKGKTVFVTMAERGMFSASPEGAIEHVPALPLRGPIDVVGAGDAVTASLGAALAAGATSREAMELAIGAASLVIHQLGTTGTASVSELRELMVEGD